MDYELSMADLGIANDSTVLSADSPGELVEKVVDHLRAEHGIDMPDADVILTDGGTLGAVGPIGVAGTHPGATAGGGSPVIGAVIGAVPADLDDGAVLIIKRLRELLNLSND